MSDAVVPFLAPFLFGALAELALLGVNWQQLLQYCNQTGSADPPFNRVLVGVVFVVAAAHTACSIRTVYYYSVECYGRREAFVFATWSFALDPLFTSSVALVVQSHYAWKIYILSNRRALLLSLAICILSLVSLGFGISCTWGLFYLETWARAYGVRYLTTTYLVGIAGADVLIATGFTYYLRKSRGSFADTDRLIDRIVGLTVANNGLTAVSAILACVLWGSATAGWQFFGGIICRLYACSFYSALNARARHRRDLEAAREARQARLEPVAISSMPALRPSQPGTAEVGLPEGRRITFSGLFRSGAGTTITTAGEADGELEEGRRGGGKTPEMQP
ncbi:hypothetical protein JCM8097_007907 [Rhodosporidiobolus ruineniae]